MILAQEDLEDDRTTHLRRVEHTTGTSACMASTHGLRGCGRGSMCCLEGSEMMDAARCFFLFPPKSQVPSISWSCVKLKLKCILSVPSKGYFTEQMTSSSYLVLENRPTEDVFPFQEGGIHRDTMNFHWPDWSLPVRSSLVSFDQKLSQIKLDSDFDLNLNNAANPTAGNVAKILISNGESPVDRYISDSTLSINFSF